jgi:two-component system chemotaxis response regulator CheB
METAHSGEATGGADTIKRDIVVIGASAGGVEALMEYVGHLPSDVPAAIFVVLHLAPGKPSALSHILGRAGPILCQTAEDGAPIEQSHLYVASTDYHLLLTRDEMRVVRGPRENRHRPAIDPLFRSAAVAFGKRVIGIVLSGALDDGTAGLLAIKRSGGIAMVQDPATAAFSSMPESALTYVAVDWSLPVAALADKTVSLATVGTTEQEGAVATMPGADDDQREQMKIETEIAGLNPDAISRGRHIGKLSSLTCPDCHGPLWEIQDESLLRFRCRVGHAFTAETMFEGQEDNVEEALWMALNILEESRQLYTRLARHSRARQHVWMANRFEKRASDIQQRAHVIRNLLVPDAPNEEARWTPQHPEAPESTEVGG